nr:hypothetical protein [Methylosinus sp. LW4]
MSLDRSKSMESVGFPTPRVDLFIERQGVAMEGARLLVVSIRAFDLTEPEERIRLAQAFADQTIYRQRAAIGDAGLVVSPQFGGEFPDVVQCRGLSQPIIGFLIERQCFLIGLVGRIGASVAAVQLTEAGPCARLP